jgi:hypothetical protein
MAHPTSLLRTPYKQPPLPRPWEWPQTHSPAMQHRPLPRAARATNNSYLRRWRHHTPNLMRANLQ